MAYVTIDRTVGEDPDLPNVCMMCGRHAPGRTLLVYPQRAPEVLAFLAFGVPALTVAPLSAACVVAAVLALRRFVLRQTAFHAPLCPVHSQPTLRTYSWLVVPAAVLAVACFVGGTAMLVDSGRWGDPLITGWRPPFEHPAGSLGDRLKPIFLFIMPGTILCGMVGLHRFAEHRPQLKGITKVSITLGGVSAIFAQAYEACRKPAIDIPDDATSYWWQQRHATPGAAPADPSDAVREESD